MSARWLAFVIWGLVAASAAGWGLRLFVPGQAVPQHASTVDASAVAHADLTRLFGVDAPPPAAVDEAPRADARFRLLGVAAPKSGADRPGGLALIAVDGKPARAYRIGAVVDGEVVLQGVRARGATLGPRGGVATISLEIPALAPAATGTMPAGDARGAAAPPMPAPQGAQPLPAVQSVSPVPIQPGQPPSPDATAPQLPQS